MNKPKFWRSKHNRYRGGNSRGRGGRGNVMNGHFGGNRNDFQNQNQNFTRPYHHKRKFQRNAPTARLSEEDIGVTEYMNDHEGFNGIIKSRYSDFQVSEINLNGEVAKLTNIEPPELPKEKAIDEDEDLVLNKYNLEILPMETWDNINRLAVANNKCTEKVQIDVTGMTKEQRTQIHDAVKKAFGKGIVGSTVTVGDTKYVSLEKFRKGIRVDKRVKWLWPGEYTYFIVHKENCDTMEAAARLADRLRITLKPSMLGYAGTKDRRAKTSQWFSLRKVEPARIAAAGRELREMIVGNYSFSNVNLRLGMLKGNKFRIVLRNVTASDECMDRACQLLQRDGFVNYYGPQRFGTRKETPTYEIGLKLFQGKLMEAIMLILQRRSGPLEHVLQVFHEEGAAAAWLVRPRGARVVTELRIIESLADEPNDLVRALDRIPRNARLLYMHAYQSLMWNRVASRRLQQLGTAPAVGDLVPLTPIEIEEELVDEEYSDTDDVDVKDTDTTDDADAANPPDEKKTKAKKGTEEKKEVLVKVLTQEDLDSGQYSITDVVLPLPGWSIKYPPNMLDYYTELLTKDGLTLEMKNRIKQFCMSGAYRPLAVRPGESTWRVVRYEDPHCDLLRSDRDELEGNQLKPQPPDGKYKALMLSFTLPTSCYATMALRELMKVDTSCDKQALQNNYHKASKPAGNTQQTADNVVSEVNEQSQSGGESDRGGDKRKLDTEQEGTNKKVKQDV